MAQDVTNARLIFMVVKVDRKMFKNFTVITGELRHNLMVVDVDKKRKKEGRVEA